MQMILLKKTKSVLQSKGRSRRGKIRSSEALVAAPRDNDFGALLQFPDPFNLGEYERGSKSWGSVSYYC